MKSSAIAQLILEVGLTSSFLRPAKAEPIKLLWFSVTRPNSQKWKSFVLLLSSDRTGRTTKFAQVESRLNTSFHSPWLLVYSSPRQLEHEAVAPLSSLNPSLIRSNFYMGHGIQWLRIVETKVKKLFLFPCFPNPPVRTIECLCRIHCSMRGAVYSLESRTLSAWISFVIVGIL